MVDFGTVGATRSCEFATSALPVCLAPWQLDGNALTAMAEAKTKATITARATTAAKVD